MKKRPKLMTVIAICAIVLAAISIYRTWTGRGKNVAVEAYSGEGSLQAAQAAEYLQQRSPVVVLAFESEAKSQVNQPLQSMIQTLKTRGLSIRQVEYLRFDAQSGWKEGHPGFPYEEFLRVAKKYPGVTAVISLCGAPYLQETTERPDPRSLPLLMIPRSVEMTRSLSRLIQEGRVAMAVVDRKGPASNAAQDKNATPEMLFNSKYEVLTDLQTRTK